MIKKLIILLIIFYSQSAWAVAPAFNSHADATSTAGSTYTTTISLSAGSGAGTTFYKEYGPDAMTVDKTTGAVSWTIPFGLPDESFYIGVAAMNSDGRSKDVWVLSVGTGNVIYCGPGETYTTIAAGTAAMSAGDTLIVVDGTYTGSTNMIYSDGGSRGNIPSSGTSSGYSTIMAQNPGGAIIDGEDVRIPISFKGNYVSRHGTPSAYDSRYIALKGFLCGNSSGSVVSCISSQYIKFMHIGGFDMAATNGSIFNINTSGYILLESCYGYGHGRESATAYMSDYVIMRRNLFRIDRSTAAEPIGGSVLYSSQYSRMNNNIVIDSDQTDYWLNNTYHAGAFISDCGGNSATDYGQPIDTVMNKNIALNVYGQATVASSTTQPSYEAPEFFDYVVWDIHAMPQNSSSTSSSATFRTTDVEFTRLTVGDITTIEYATANGCFFNGYDNEGSGAANTKMNDSIISNVNEYGGAPGGLFYDYGEVANNNLYDVGTVLVGNINSISATGTVTYDPKTNGLEYIVRTEAGSALKTAGIGADVTTMKGVGGTLWGETGYDSDTTTKMWPFPGEQEMQENMRAYTYDGGALTGARGFCESGVTQLNGVDDLTLTSYVWEYLGNEMPSDIYGSSVGGSATFGSATIESITWE